MVGPKHHIRSFLETVSVSAVENALEEILFSHFTKKERALFEQRPVQSIAGQMALKSAVLRLAADLAAAVRLERQHVEIVRDPSGAPRIGSVICADAELKAVLENELHLSISHTRTTAVGLAVISTVIDTGDNENDPHTTKF